MAKYIDAEALGIGIAKAEIFANSEFARGWNNAIKIINNAPAADVVEVVRCRDCKHSYRIDGAKEEYDCAKISAFAKFFPGDHFCGYGKRKTDG